MNLFTALNRGAIRRVAFTGAGGKTTAIFQLARQIPGPVLVTASTHLGIWQATFADRHQVIATAQAVEDTIAGSAGKVILVTGPLEEASGRLDGVSPQVLDALHELASRYGWPLLIEADGSRQKPLKAPADHEPVIPGWAETVVVAAGLSGLSKPLTDDNVHRAALYSALTGAESGMAIEAAMLTAALLHPNGGLKGIPPKARKVVLLNQADTDQLRQIGSGIAKQALAGYDAALVATLQAEIVYEICEPTAGIILSAGAARRFGQYKPLLEWGGQTFIFRVAAQALAAGLWPIRVVAGEEVSAIRAALAGLPVEIIHNPDWDSGQSTSVRAGLRDLPARCGAAIFLLADQPQVQQSILCDLADLHARTLAAIVSPRIGSRRTNPVLFDKATFSELNALEGDTGGRPLFERYIPEWLDLADDRMLLDVDTQEDYAALLRLNPEDA